MNTAFLFSRDFFQISLYGLCLLFFLTIVFFFPKGVKPLIFSTENKVNLDNTYSYIQFLDSRSVNLESIRQNKMAPNIHSINLPGDLNSYPSQQRSELFITLILSHAVKCQEEILQQRRHLIRYMLDKKYKKYVSPSRNEWYRQMAKKYAGKQVPSETLLEYVDIIPVSLTISQAITESGWGTSRFAQKGNALYGQHLSRRGGQKYMTSLSGNVRVATFDSLLESTRSYMYNLNSSRAYRELRSIRKNIRSRGERLDGHSLAAGLLHYSEIGEDYIRLLRFLMKKYDLQGLDGTLLNKEELVVLQFSREKDKIGHSQPDIKASRKKIRVEQHKKLRS